jgi:hypothetical protein
MDQDPAPEMDPAIFVSDIQNGNKKLFFSSFILLIAF